MGSLTGSGVGRVSRKRLLAIASWPFLALPLPVALGVWVPALALSFRTVWPLTRPSLSLDFGAWNPVGFAVNTAIVTQQWRGKLRPGVLKLLLRAGLARSRQGGQPWPQGPSPDSAGPLRFTSKNKHVPQARPVPPGQSRLCARPAAPAAQAILISVWVHAGVANQSPRSLVPAPQPPPPVPGSTHPAGSRGQWSLFEFESWPLWHVIQEPSLSFPRYSQQSLQPASPPSVACAIGR